MANPISGIPNYPVFVWPFTLPAIAWEWNPDTGPTVSGTTSVSTVAILPEYSGAETIATKLISEIAPINTSGVAVAIADAGCRISIQMEGPGELTFSSGTAAIGASYSETIATFQTGASDIIELPYSPFGYWQPRSSTPWYEYRNVARAIVSESVSGSARYRSEWGSKTDALFTCSNVKRARLFASAGDFFSGVDAGFNEAAGRPLQESNGTFEAMIQAARSIDVITAKTDNFDIYCSIIDPAILSDFTAALTETDGKRMYDVSLPLRHIGFG